MLKHKLISLREANEWEKTINNFEYSVGHTHAYNLCFVENGSVEPYLYVGYDASGPRIILNLLKRAIYNEFDAATPYGNGGLLYNDVPDKWFENWSTFMAGKGFVSGYFSMNQACHYQELSKLQFTVQNMMYGVDLTKDLNELARNLGHNNRRNLRRWREKRFELIYDQPLLKTLFPEMYMETAKISGYKSRYQFDTNLLRSFTDLKGAYLIGVMCEKKILAIRLYLSTAYCAEAYLHANLPGEIEHSRALYWAGIEYFKKIQIPYLNLGGGIMQGDQIASFKKKLSTTQRPLYTMKVIFDQHKYRTLCQRANVTKNKTSYFPAYRLIDAN